MFYEQYLTIKEDVAINLGISLGLSQYIIMIEGLFALCISPHLAGVFVMSFLLMGFNLISALMVTATVLLIIIDMLGMMAWVSISLNAVSLVNLVMVMLIYLCAP